MQCALRASTDQVCSAHPLPTSASCLDEAPSFQQLLMARVNFQVAGKGRVPDTVCLQLCAELVSEVLNRAGYMEPIRGGIVGDRVVR